LIAGLITAIALHILGGLSHNHSNFLLASLSIIVSAAFTQVLNTGGRDVQERRNLQRDIDHTLSNWSQDIRTAMDYFDLNPDF
ncbi:hypothetical protein BJ138DRAFT_988126, partial [Hygrophoropsis aurantiaca]